MENVIYQTELTIAFTRDGKILLPQNKAGKNTIFSKYSVGFRDGYEKDLSNNEVGFFLKPMCIQDESEYKSYMATEIGRRDKHFDESSIEEGFLIGNGNALIDMGQLTDSIYDFQIQEMKRFSGAGYIRAGRNTFHLKTVGKVDIFENVGYRFLLLPNGANENTFRGCSWYTLDELKDLVVSNPESCTMDLLVAMRQLDESDIQRFVMAINRQVKMGNCVQTRGE